MAVITYPGNQSGTYLVNLSSGVIGAALANGAAIAAIRCGPTQTNPAIGNTTRSIFITEIGIKVSGVVAFTAPQQFALGLCRFTGANYTAGAFINNFFKVSSSTAPNSTALTGGPEGGDTRAATTVGLTQPGGVVLDNNIVSIYSWAGVGPGDFSDDVISFADNPIRLGPGEGLALLNVIAWPAAGTAIVGCYFKYEERING